MGVLPVVNENDTLAVAVCIRHYAMIEESLLTHIRKSNSETTIPYQL